MRPVVLLTLFGITLALASCGNPPPVQVDFATSPAIFRGTYTTEVDMRNSTPEVAFSPDGSSLVMGNGDHFHALQFWNVATATPTGTTEEEFPVTSVAMSPDGARIAAVLPGEAVNLPGSARVWDTQSGEVLLQFPAGSPDCLQCLARALAISPDSKTLALLSVREYAEYEPTSEVSLYDLKTGKPLSVLGGPAPSPTSYTSFRNLSFSPDGSRLAAFAIGSYEPATVAVWDVGEAKLLDVYSRKTPELEQVDPHLWRDNEPVLAVYGNGKLELQSVMSGQVLATLPTPPDGLTPYELYASADGTRLIGGTQGKVVLWDLEAGSIMKVLSDGIYYGAGFSPDGRYALVWDDTTKALTLRDPDTLEVEVSLSNGSVLPLTLVSNATYVNGQKYSIDGTAQLGEESSVPFSGEVLGKETQVFLKPQFGCICPIPASLRLTFVREGRTWTLDAYEGGESGNAWDAATLDEKSALAAPSRTYNVLLKKEP